MRGSDNRYACVYIRYDAPENISFSLRFLLDAEVGRYQAKERQDTHFS